jgi:hypothetical protein
VQQIQSAVVYDGLPISSGGAHGLGRTSIHDAFSSWRGFLESCTIADAVSCYFHLPHTPELEPARRTVRKIRKAFPAKGHRFPVPPDRIHEALDLMASLEPLPTNPWGMAPIWLSADAAFSLKTPAGNIWPNQNPTAFGAFETPTGVTLGTSRTTLHLEARRSLGLHLSIPEATDEDLTTLIPWLQAHLPFRLSPNHWTRWTLTKNNRTYRSHRLTL